MFRNCRLLGWQDTLYAASGRQLYENCYIEGHVDFIFGNAAALFRNCEIHSLGTGYIAAQSRVTPDGGTGFVFDRCKLTADSDGFKVFLGRPWRPYSRVVYLNCFMGPHIRPEGWDNWRNQANESTAWFAESGSTGPGGSQEKRVAWERHPTRSEWDAVQPEKLLAGEDGWRP